MSEPCEPCSLCGYPGPGQHLYKNECIRYLRAELEKARKDKADTERLDWCEEHGLPVNKPDNDTLLYKAGDIVINWDNRLSRIVMDGEKVRRWERITIREAIDNMRLAKDSTCVA